MSDFATDFFELDDSDDSYDGGGFDGFDAFDAPPKDDPKAKTEEGNPVKIEEPIEVAKETPAPVDNSAHLIGVIAKQTEQINTLLESNKPKEPAPEPPAKPEFTQAEWEDNPAQCTQSMYEYNREIETRTEAEHTAQATAHDQEQLGKIQAAHNEGWAAVLEAVPALNTNESTPLRSMYAQHFEAVKNDPMGTIKAMNALKKDPRAQEYLKPAPIKDPAPEQIPASQQAPADLEAAKVKGAADEKARQSRVQAGVMHGSGKGGGQQKIALTPAQRSAAHQFGVSEESYAASLKAMGGDI